MFKRLRLVKPAPADPEQHTNLAIEVSPRDAQAALASQNEACTLLDCRELSEHAFAHIPGCKLIPLGEIANRLDELDSLRNSRIIVYCHSGVRSLRATTLLRRAGFASAQSLKGGIDQWSREIDPSIPRQ